MHSGKRKKSTFAIFFVTIKFAKTRQNAKPFLILFLKKILWRFDNFFFFDDVVLKIRNWFYYYFTGKIHGVGQRMDEKIRNVMRLEEKQETKQQEKLSKISKTTHIISRKKPNKFRTPKNNSSYSRKKVNFSCRNFFSWNAPRLTRDGHKNPLPKLKSYWKALLLKKQPNFELKIICSARKICCPENFTFFFDFFFRL